MRHRRNFLYILVCAMGLDGCAPSNFTGASAPRTKGMKSDQRKEDNQLPSSGETRQQMPSCWAAVSGARIGMVSENSESSFPRTKSGRPIGHGEAFDSKDGVFLESRDKPYMWEGVAAGSRIRSILIAPGMTVEFDVGFDRTFKENGPFIGYFNVYDPPENKIYEEELRARTDLPLWLNDYLKTGKGVARLGFLPSGSYPKAIKVSTVVGGLCDSTK